MGATPGNIGTASDSGAWHPCEDSRDSKVCRDPHDDMFLECAALAKADLLVAGDKDLLTLGAYEGTRILTPSAYLKAG